MYSYSRNSGIQLIEYSLTIFILGTKSGVNTTFWTQIAHAFVFKVKVGV